ncbi:MAG: TolC family protein [bacterium]|nr:TolC family protein [bacterium]
MKKIILLGIITLLLSFGAFMNAYAIQDVPAVQAKKAIQNAHKLEIAFVFDSNAEKTGEVLKTYKPIITKSLLPDYQAVFSEDLIFKGNWDEQSSIIAAQKALKSRAGMIVCFGYWSGEYLKKNNHSKNVITVDEYAIRGFSDKFFNPVQQSVNDFVVFQRLVPNLGKTAILLNERIYNSKSNWNELARKGFKEKGCNVDFVIIPVGSDIEKSLKTMPNDVKSVYVTQVYNLSTEQRKNLYDYLAQKKLPSFSSMGKEDVVLGAMLGTSTRDLDKKLAETVSFNIKNVLKGSSVKSTPVTFVDDNVLFFNKDTAELIGYTPHVRLLKSVEVISNKKLEVRNLGYIFDAFAERNLTVQRKKYLIDAARRALVSAYLHYLPTLRVDLGHQTYNSEYAKSYSDVPTRVGVFTYGIDQVLYSPDLVTNILVKHKKLKFDKAEKVLAEQSMGLQIAQLYVDYIMMSNSIKYQEQYVDDVKNCYAMAKIRKLSGKCGDEEVLRWAGEVNHAEKNLLLARSEFDNVKIHINQLLNSDQTSDFELAPIKVTDSAFFLSDINLLDHIRTPDKMEKFTQMLVQEAIYVSPETTKLKAAIAMKKAEMANYGQKFFLPNAKLTLEHSKQFDRNLPYEQVGHYQMATPAAIALGGSPYLGLDKDSTRFMIVAQWKPIEGGTKIAEMARCKAELNELNTYLEEVNTEIEFSIRTTVNRAIAKYLCIERAYRALSAEEENYRLVKEKYLMGKVTIPQVLDAMNAVRIAREDAANSQYDFYKELLWVQRGLVSVNWANASDEAREFIAKLKKELEPEADINVNL